MYGAAAKSAKEMELFPEDCHGDSRGGQKQPEHHARRSATGDADLTPRLASCSHAQMMNKASTDASPDWPRISPHPKFRRVRPLSETPCPSSPAGTASTSSSDRRPPP